MKILLAEDTKDLNRAVTAILTHEGYDVTSAYDGQEASDYLQQDSFDVIILDIMMPKKDGLQVLQELRGHGIVTPVMMLTAKTEVDDRVTGLDMGADDYLTKPFAMKELIARVRSLTRRMRDYNDDHIQYADITLDSASFELTSGNTVRLSIKEYELMRTLILNKDVDLSTQYLIEHVWKNEDAQADTVWLYISYLRAKLMSIGSSVQINGQRGGSFRITQQ
ncbi:MAG: response regulator transcription factor [Lachnospiraceae bacterium]|jgi:DNA-binding response OmpR family regulator